MDTEAFFCRHETTIVLSENNGISKQKCTWACGREYFTRIVDGIQRAVQPCGHPLSAIVTNGTTSYCGQCADDSLRANIAAGVEN